MPRLAIPRVSLFLVCGFISLQCVLIASDHVESKRFLLRTEPCHCFQGCSCQQGTCRNNQCDCNHGWGGTDCGIETYRIPDMLTTAHGQSGQHAITETTTVNPHQLRYYERRCNSHGHQVNGICVCHDGWSGITCQHVPGTRHECDDPKCIHGICLYWLDRYEKVHIECHCDDDYYGDHCTYTNQTQGQSYLCMNQDLCEHGTCFHRTRSTYSYSCKCENGWHGHHCDENRADRETIMCGEKICRHGTCDRYHDSWGNPHYKCDCDAGWRGDHCDREEYSQCGYYSLQCLHGECYYNVYNGRQYNHHCVCIHGWHGNKCDQQITPTSTTVSTTPSTVPTTTPSTVPTAMPSTVPTTTPSTVPTTTPSTVPTTTPSTVPTTAPSTVPTTVMMVFTATTALKSTAGTTTDTKAPILPILTKAPSTPGGNNTTSTMVTPQANFTIFSECNATSFKTDFNNGVKSVNLNTTQCPSGQHESSEAFILEHCNVSDHPTTWRQGNSVATLCNSTSSMLPPYTPIATFDNGIYSPIGSRAGIFLRCLSNGFEMAYQTCDKPPHSTNIINGGSFIQDPSVYYVVM
ncbi:hypothetical protein ACF0H5_023982 [Mactra antiquata]